MNRFIFMVLATLMLIFANSGYCEEKGVKGLTRKMEQAIINIKITPQVAQQIFDNKGVEQRVVDILAERVLGVPIKGRMHLFHGVAFSREAKQWYLLLKPVRTI